MKTLSDDLERRILKAIQGGLPLSKSPFEQLAHTAGLPVEQLLAVLKQWKAEGKIRRVGAIVNHFQTGHGVGAMVVWQVPESKTEAVGQLFASVDKVSHAYLRQSSCQWPYNMYTMVHASDEGELENIIQAMSAQSGITEYRVLKTIRELKKTPPRYIAEQ